MLLRIVFTQLNQNILIEQHMTRILTLIASVSLLGLASCASTKGGSCCGSDKKKAACCESAAKDKKECTACDSAAAKKKKA